MRRAFLFSRLGKAWLGVAGRGTARQGLARLGMGCLQRVVWHAMQPSANRFFTSTDLPCFFSGCFMNDFETSVFSDYDLERAAREVDYLLAIGLMLAAFAFANLFVFVWKVLL